MDYMTLKEASEKWGISVRRINFLCSEGRISNAVKRQNMWLIPSLTPKPTDGRRKKLPLKHPEILLRNSTYIENHSPSDLCDYDLTICECTQQFLEGQLEEGISGLKKLISSCNDKQYLLIANYILNYYSPFAGDIHASKTSQSNMRKLLHDPDVSDIAKTMVRLNDSTDYRPNLIFTQIDNVLLEDLYPYLSLKALRYHLTASLIGNYTGYHIYHEIACHSLKDNNCPEVYVVYNIILAVYYSISGLDLYCQMHLKVAAEIAFPRGWYTPFAQYSITLNLDYLDTIDHNAYIHICLLSDKILKNLAKFNLFSENTKRSKSEDIEQLQIAYQIACGKTNSEIAAYLGQSVYKIKKYISNIYARSGCSTRKEIKDYILSHIML